MIRDLIWKTSKMGELILEEEVIPFQLEIWAIYFKCLWVVVWEVVEEDEVEEEGDFQEDILILEVKVRENSSLSDLAEGLIIKGQINNISN